MGDGTRQVAPLYLTNLAVGTLTSNSNLTRRCVKFAETIAKITQRTQEAMLRPEVLQRVRANHPHASRIATPEMKVSQWPTCLLFDRAALFETTKEFCQQKQLLTLASYSHAGFV